MGSRMQYALPHTHSHLLNYIPTTNDVNFHIHVCKPKYAFKIILIHYDQLSIPITGILTL